MGILNVTPDSFSDGGEYSTPASAIRAGRALVQAGADIIDIGGESTRPGAKEVDQAEEISKILPVIKALAAEGVIISADTRHAVTMAAALDAGARIINDVSALRHDPEALRMVARCGCPVILMHMRGVPETMGCHAHYTDLVSEVMQELAERRDAALNAGISPAAIALDPGIGFAKKGGQNVLLLRELARFGGLGHTIVAGLSRKHFIGMLAGEKQTSRRDPGSIAAAIFAVCRGAAVLRVHDVAGTVQALRVWRALAAS